MPNIYQRLIERVAKRDWVEAQGLFKSILEQKVALRLEAEKKLLQEPDAAEDANLKECPECGCEFDPSKGTHGQYTECSGCYGKKK